jgi:hypothetical protein
LPFTTANQASLTKFLPAAAFEVFLKAANEGEAAGLVHNDCIKQAWAATKEAGWQPPASGKKWIFVNKDDPGGGDVHVEAPLGSKKPKKKDGGSADPADYCDDGYEKTSLATVLKVDNELGLVFGWAIICKQRGADYYDVQGDHIPENSMLSAAADFMQNSRVAKDMHQGDEVGPVVFAWPMTADIAKAMGIVTDTSGLMIAMKPPAGILEKFRSGEYTGFSIGGQRVTDEEV